MHYLTDETLDRLLTYETLVPALKEMHLKRPDDQADMLLEQPAGAGGLDRLLNRAAWQQGEALGIKLVTIFPNNPTNGSGRPSVQGVYILFGGELGEPQAVMDAQVLTWRKTAADSALGASFLAREDATKLLMVGSGAMAPELIRAHLSQRSSLSEIVIWNRNLERAEKLAKELAPLLDGRNLLVTDDLEAAAREADLISCATMSEEPLIKGAWLKPGAHLDLVGAYTPSMRETDDESFRRGRLFVDSRETTVGHIGEVMLPMAAGVIGESDIQADLFELSEGSAAGRRSGEEITLFKNGGGGHLDLMTARHGVARAKEEGLI